MKARLEHAQKKAADLQRFEVEQEELEKFRQTFSRIVKKYTTRQRADRQEVDVIASRSDEEEWKAMQEFLLKGTNETGMIPLPMSASSATAMQTLCTTALSKASQLQDLVTRLRRTNGELKDQNNALNRQVKSVKDQTQQLRAVDRKTIDQLTAYIGQVAGMGKQVDELEKSVRQDIPEEGASDAYSRGSTPQAAPVN